MVCPPCDAKCKTCTGASDSCTSCNTGGNYHRIDLSNGIGNGDCPCEIGFADIGTKECVPCDYSCLDCEINNPKICKNCDFEKNRILVMNACMCREGYFENQDNKNC